METTIVNPNELQTMEKSIITEQDAMRREEETIHSCAEGAINELGTIREYAALLAYELNGKNKLRLKKALHVMDFYLKVIELNTRDASDEEADTDEYERECDMYGM